MFRCNQSLYPSDLVTLHKPVPKENKQKRLQNHSDQVGEFVSSQTGPSAKYTLTSHNGLLLVDFASSGAQKQPTAPVYEEHSDHSEVKPKKKQKRVVDDYAAMNDDGGLVNDYEEGDRFADDDNPVL